VLSREAASTNWGLKLKGPLDCSFNLNIIYSGKHQMDCAQNIREDFLKINQSETRIACGGHVC
jgi:hypothetical protein